MLERLRYFLNRPGTKWFFIIGITVFAGLTILYEVGMAVSHIVTQHYYKIDRIKMQKVGARLVNAGVEGEKVVFILDPSDPRWHGQSSLIRERLIEIVAAARHHPLFDEKMLPLRVGVADTAVILGYAFKPSSIVLSSWPLRALEKDPHVFDVTLAHEVSHLLWIELEEIIYRPPSSYRRPATASFTVLTAHGPRWRQTCLDLTLRLYGKLKLGSSTCSEGWSFKERIDILRKSL